MEEMTAPQDPKELPAPLKKRKLSLSLVHKDHFQMLTSMEVEDACKAKMHARKYHQKKPMIDLLISGCRYLSWKLARKTVEGVLHLLLPTAMASCTY